MGLEIDAVIHLYDGMWVAFQIQMGTNLFDDAAKKLKNFAKK